MSSKTKILIVGPYPPSIGGISTFIKNIMMKNEILNEFELILFRTGSSDSRFLIIKGISELKCVMLFILFFRYIDIFHIHTSSALGFYRNVPYVIFGKFIYKKKVILHVHGGEFDKFYKQNNFIIKKLIEFTLGSSNAIIVTSNYWTDIIKKISRNRSPIYVIPNGFDDKIFRPKSRDVSRKELSLPNNKYIILTIGALEDHKGHKFLIECMRNMVKQQKDVIAYIIGNGSLKNYLCNLINEYSLNSHIILAGGNKPASELVLWYNASDVFVLPSLIEGNPTVMFECMGCGKPFIGTRVGGIPDIIKSEEYGYIAEPEDVNDLCMKISLAMTKKWNSEAINNYASGFTWENIGKYLREVYINVIHK